MKYHFTVYSLITWILCIYVVGLGKSTHVCDDKYKVTSYDCTSTCDQKGEGLHHTSSCESYCTCRIFEKYFFKIHRYCPEGMVFNRLIESCDSPDNYVCPGSRPPVPADYTCPQPEGKFAHPECCVLYIMCSHNVPYTLLCPSNSHFSAERQKCEYPELAGCRRNESTDPEETTASPTTPTPAPEFKCPRSNGHFPDKNNCNKFFICATGVSDHRSCLPEMHFNPSLRTCDWPDRAGCLPGKDVMDFSKPIGRCSVIGSAEGDENDCTKFYFCDYGSLFYESCPKDYYFDETQKACFPGVPGKCSSQGPLFDNVCSGACDNCKIPDPHDRHRYFQCVGGKGRRRKCYLGQRFCNDKVPCDIDCNLKIGLGKSTHVCDDKYKVTSSDCTSTCEQKGEGLHPTSSCESYCTCRIFEKRYFKIYRYCPEGMVFNRLIKSCDSPDNYVCPGSRPPVPADYTCPQPEGKFAYPECCVLYIMCSHNVPYTLLCPSNSHFSAERQKCEYPELAGCRCNESKS